MISNNTSMPTTDDELQKNTVGELKPHNAPITLVEYDSSCLNCLSRDRTGFIQYSAAKRCKQNMWAQPRFLGFVQSQSSIYCWLLRILLMSHPTFQRWQRPDMCYRFENLTGLSIVCLKDRIPILICMCSVWAHQRLIECYASVIGCGLMILIGTNMHKSNEAWQRINGGMSSTMRMLKHQQYRKS